MHLDGLPSREQREMVFFHDTDYLRQAPLLTLPLYLFGATPTEIAERLVRGGAHDDVEVLGRFRLNAESVDSRGNETVNRHQLVDHVLRDRVLQYPPVAIGAPPSDYAKRALAGLVHWAGERDIRVLATWPNVLERPEYRSAEYQHYFGIYEEYFESIGVPLIGEPEMAMLPLDDMFDTIYHPNDAGRQRRTALLVEALCREAFDCRF